MFYWVSYNIKDSSSEVIPWERHSLNLVFTLKFPCLYNSTHTVYMICNNKRVAMNFSGSLQENSLSTVWWQETDLNYCSFSCMECWSVRGHHPTSGGPLLVDLLDLGKLTKIVFYLIIHIIHIYYWQDLNYLQYKCSRPVFIHILHFLIFLIDKINWYFIDIKACQCSLLKVFRSFF